VKSKFPFGLSLSKPFCAGRPVDKLRANGSDFKGPDQSMNSIAASVVSHAIRHIKLRLFAQGGVANPRNSGTIAVVYALP
jgi:hypothetical protein